MKSIFKAFLFLSLTTFSLALLGCSNGDNDNATISISINVESAAAAKAVSIDQLQHVITLSGPTGTQTHRITGNGTVKATVAAGLWNIDVTAYNEDKIYAVGFTSVEVKAGRNTDVTVQMTVVWTEPVVKGGGGGGSSNPNQSPPYITPGVVTIPVDKEVSTWAELKNYIEVTLPLLSPSSSVIQITGNLTADSEITVQSGTTATLVSPPGTRVTISRDGGFTSANWMFRVDGFGYLNLGNHNPSYLDNNMLTLDGSGGALNEPLILLFGGTPIGGSLFMYENVVLENNDRSSLSSANGGAIEVGSLAEFLMVGGEIRGNKAGTNGSGGGVYVNEGAFNMDGGTIGPGNEAGQGGGVGVFGPGASFSMTGDATISGNSASLGGGGVYAYGPDPIIVMQGGVIKSNTAASGGGVYVNCTSGNGFFMAGGTIGGTSLADANTANGNPAMGGGVYIDGAAEFTMTSDAAIIGNYAEPSIPDSAHGGGVCFGSSSSGLFKMIDSARINNNFALSTTPSFASYGGGVYFDDLASGDFTMDGNAEINGNTAYSDNNVVHGGGVYFGSSGNFTMNNPGTTPKINNNTAQSDSTFALGGGVYLANGTFVLNEGEINGNTVKGLALPYGGGTAGGGVFFDCSASYPLPIFIFDTTNISLSLNEVKDLSNNAITMNPGNSIFLKLLSLEYGIDIDLPSGYAVSYTIDSSFSSPTPPTLWW